MKEITYDDIHQLAHTLSDIAKEKLEELGKEIDANDEDFIFETLCDLLEEYADIEYHDSQY